MTETKLQRALRLARENGYYGRMTSGVCPLCGMSTLIRSATGAHCYNCHNDFDIDEVMRYD